MPKSTGRGAEVARSQSRVYEVYPAPPITPAILKIYSPVNAHICQFENATPTDAKTLDSSPKFNDRYATQKKPSVLGLLSMHPSSTW